MLRLQNFLKCFLIKSQTFMKDTPVITTPPVAFWVLGFDYSNPASSSPPYIYVCVWQSIFWLENFWCKQELYIILAVHVYQSFNISACSYQIVPMSYIYTCASSLVILAMSISHLVLLNRIIHLINLLKGEYF